ncbi:hypothetical protein K9M09_01295 [Patescibacteria group bacterium]|nr:hypothetical protein [Patescibacteria group bacterium]
MFKTISQIIILIVFLFLTIFVAVWFDDTGGKDEPADSRQSLTWLSESAKITGSVITVFLPHTENKKTDSGGPEDTYNEISESPSLIEDVPSMYDNVSDSASNFINNPGEDNEFREFVSDIVQKTPEYYLDMKMYNNAWKNFWSFYWLKFNENIDN